MNDQQKIQDPALIDPGPSLTGQRIRGETLGCPTGLSDVPAELPPASPPQGADDTVEARGPLQVEKLEGRQESGRDAQDEDEEDEPED